MTSIAQPRIVSSRQSAISRERVFRWAGRLATGLSVAFLFFDSVIKLLRVPAVVEGMPLLGYPASLAVPIGIILLACVILYVTPRTSVFGAILLTGYLGGAVATHVRVGNPLFSHSLFPIYFGILIWGGLYLRDARSRALIPFKSPNS